MSSLKQRVQPKPWSLNMFVCAGSCFYFHSVRIGNPSVKVVGSGVEKQLGENTVQRRLAGCCNVPNEYISTKARKPVVLLIFLIDLVPIKFKKTHTQQGACLITIKWIWSPFNIDFFKCYYTVNTTVSWQNSFHVWFFFFFSQTTFSTFGK